MLIFVTTIWVEKFCQKIACGKKTNIGFSCGLSFVTEEICLVLKCTVDSIFTRLTFAHIRVYGHIPIYGHMSIHIYGHMSIYMGKYMSVRVHLFLCSRFFTSIRTHIALITHFLGDGAANANSDWEMLGSQRLYLKLITVLKKLFILAIWVTSNDDPGIL